MSQILQYIKKHPNIFSNYPEAEKYVAEHGDGADIEQILARIAINDMGDMSKAELFQKVKKEVESVLKTDYSQADFNKVLAVIQNGDNKKVAAQLHDIAGRCNKKSDQ